MSAAFQIPATVLTGGGCFDELGRVARPLGKRALLVTGKRAMQAQGFVDRAKELLQAEGAACAVFGGVAHDPELEIVEAARRIFRKEGCDLLIGLGGGSAIDAAKAVAGMAPSDKEARAFFDGEPLAATDVPLIAVPSTFGTGTEATRVSVLSDKARHLKRGIRHDTMLPRAAIVDPELGKAAPPALTAACGMDALTQAMESFLSRHAAEITRALSLQATRLLATHLPRAFRDGADMDARAGCADASLMAGMALHNARLGVVHGLAHPLGARYGLIHGEVCGTLLPLALRFNRETDGYRRLRDVLGTDPADLAEKLLREMNLPTDLRHVGIPESDFDLLVPEILASGSTRANPREVNEPEARALLREACV